MRAFAVKTSFKEISDFLQLLGAECGYVFEDDSPLPVDIWQWAKDGGLPDINRQDVWVCFGCDWIIRPCLCNFPMGYDTLDVEEAVQILLMVKELRQEPIPTPKDQQLDLCEACGWQLDGAMQCTNLNCTGD